MGAIPLADNAYLKRRCGKRRSGYRWYVRINVPADLQEIFRMRTIERALNTSDFKEAQKLRHAAFADIHADFDRARLAAVAVNQQNTLKVGKMRDQAFGFAVKIRASRTAPFSTEPRQRQTGQLNSNMRHFRAIT